MSDLQPRAPRGVPGAGVQVAGAGFSMVVSVIAGLLLGFAGAKYLHWALALPLGLFLGFAAGLLSMVRQLGRG